jgi:3-deoxy-D-manno-octulosonic-acid transferase
MRLIFYNLLFPIAFVLYLPFFVRKLIKRGGAKNGFGERFGIFSAKKRQELRALNRPVWIHAVSVGEAVAACSFIQRWKETDPELDFVLSTTTTTGHAVAEKKRPEGVTVLYCPLDFFVFVLRSLMLVRPRILVIFEVEMWPNLITLAKLLKIPVTLVNGRMSDRSARGYSRHRWFFKPLFNRLDCICVQSEDDAERIKRVAGLQAPVYVCNTMKFDQVPDCDAANVSTDLERAFGTGERRVWTAGSTHPGEEHLVITTFQALKKRFPSLKLVLVPRHHERSAEVIDVLREHNVNYRCLVDNPELETSNVPEDESADVLLVNTTGALMGFYAAADVVLVGKSLAGNAGGHNIIEPAIFGKPIVHGAHMENFRLVVRLFERDKATRIVESDTDLRRVMTELLEDENLRQRLGQKARAVVERHRGAVDKTLKQLLVFNA